MSELKKRPLWPILTAALIGLPVLYIAGVGPACWLVDRDLWRFRAVNMVYRPLVIASVRFGFDEALRAYRTLVPMPIISVGVPLAAADVIFYQEPRVAMPRGDSNRPTAYTPR